MNWPNAVKRKKGRVPVVATATQYGYNGGYPVNKLPKAKALARPETRGLRTNRCVGTVDGVTAATLFLQTTPMVCRSCPGQKHVLRVCLKCRDYGVSADTAYELMSEHWVPRCDWEWEPDKLQLKLPGTTSPSTPTTTPDAYCLRTSSKVSHDRQGIDCRDFEGEPWPRALPYDGKQNISWRIRLCSGSARPAAATLNRSGYFTCKMTACGPR